MSKRNMFHKNFIDKLNSVLPDAQTKFKQGIDICPFVNNEEHPKYIQYYDMFEFASFEEQLFFILLSERASVIPRDLLLFNHSFRCVPILNQHTSSVYILLANSKDDYNLAPTCFFTKHEVIAVYNVIENCIQKIIPHK